MPWWRSSILLSASAVSNVWRHMTTRPWWRMQYVIGIRTLNLVMGRNRFFQNPMKRPLYHRYSVLKNWQTVVSNCSHQWLNPLTVLSLGFGMFFLSSFISFLIDRCYYRLIISTRETELFRLRYNAANLLISVPVKKNLENRPIFDAITIYELMKLGILLWSTLYGTFGVDLRASYMAPIERAYTTFY